MKSKKNDWKLHNFVYSNFKLGSDYLIKSKNYVFFSFILFLLMGVFGYFFPMFFEEQIMNLIKDLIEKTEGLSGLELIGFIFLNNLKSSFFAVIFGLFLGIVPFFVIVVNGYVLGVVVSKVISEEGILVLWRLFPHGIFEIPAVVISIGIGIKLGMFLFVYKGKDKKEKFLNWIKNSLRVFIFIVIPLLVIAAIIEGSLIFVLK